MRTHPHFRFIFAKGEIGTHGTKNFLILGKRVIHDVIDLFLEYFGYEICRTTPSKGYNDFVIFGMLPYEANWLLEVVVSIAEGFGLDATGSGFFMDDKFQPSLPPEDPYFSGKPMREGDHVAQTIV